MNPDSFLTLSGFNTIHSCINNAIHKQNSGKFNSVSVNTECAKIFHFCLLKGHVYLGTQKLSCVHVIVKNLKHPPQNHKGTKQSSFQRGLCFQTWRVLLIVEQNPLYNFCGCAQLTQQPGEKAYWLLFPQVFFHVPLRNLFSEHTQHNPKGETYFEWNMFCLK